MPRLARLYLEKNSISTVNINGLSNLVNLVELKLSNNKLRDLPKIVNCPKLSRLCLNFNQIVRLQSGFLDEVNLEQLGVSSLLNMLGCDLIYRFEVSGLFYLLEITLLNLCFLAKFRTETALNCDAAA